MSTSSGHLKHFLHYVVAQTAIHQTALFEAKFITKKETVHKGDYLIFWEPGIPFFGFLKASMNPKKQYTNLILKSGSSLLLG